MPTVCFVCSVTHTWPQATVGVITSNEPSQHVTGNWDVHEWGTPDGDQHTDRCMRHSHGALVSEFATGREACAALEPASPNPIIDNRLSMIGYVCLHTLSRDARMYS